MDAHDFVAAGVDDFDGDASAIAGGEGQGDGAAETFETLFVNDAFERSGDFAPGFAVGKEGLRDAEGASVVVGVDEPGGYSVGAFGGHGVVDRIVDVDALHRDDVFAIVRGADLGAGLAEHGEELAGGRLFEQAAHCRVGVDVRHVDADSGVRIVLNGGLSGAVETETREDEFIVAAAGGDRQALFDLHCCHRTVLRAKHHGNEAIIRVIFPFAFGVENVSFKRVEPCEFHGAIIGEADAVVSEQADHGVKVGFGVDGVAVAGFGVKGVRQVFRVAADRRVVI